MVFIKIIVLILSIVACIYMIRYRYEIVQFVGKADWAENYLGPGGTFTIWVIIAILVVFLAATWLMFF